MGRRPSKRQVDEEALMRVPGGRDVVVDRRARRAIQAAHRLLNELSEGRRLVRDGLLTEGTFRKIYGDAERVEDEAVATIDRMRAILARGEAN
jgi:hypothetical protein